MTELDPPAAQALSRLSNGLRSPLALIAGYADLLELKPDAETLSEAPQRIKEAASDLTRIVDDLLTVYAIEANVLYLAPVPVLLYQKEELRLGGAGNVAACIAALGGLPGQVAYAASKAGQLGMVRTLASENAAHGITVNAILPGLVATEQVLAMPEEVRERVLRSVPTGRLVEPEEIAAAIAFLVGAEAAQVSGQAIAVDGAASLPQLSLGSERG